MATEPIPEIDARFGDPEATPTAWRETRALIESAELFWISTVRADGRPHVTPLPAVWHENALHFCTGADEQKGVNLARDPHCALTTGTNRWDAGLDVVVEGTAMQVVDDDRLRQLAAVWAEKYQGDWQFDVVDGAFHHEGGIAVVYRVDASKVLAFAKGTFSQTRYRIDP